MLPICKFSATFLLLLTTACAGLQPALKSTQPAALQISAEQNGSLLSRFAPLFLLEEPDISYNLIGSPAFRKDDRGKPQAFVDATQPAFYVMRRTFNSKGADYTNLIYRVHFESTPSSHLTAGNNVGLIVILTLDEQETPLLLTTVHTCGCYLAIIPTSALPARAYPDNWPQNKQKVYGETLPVKLDIGTSQQSDYKFVIRLRSGTHRVMDVQWAQARSYQQAPLLPMSSLRQLPFNGTTLSFFVTDGARKGYVRGSHKPYERWLMSWWALDWRIGEDKDFGPHRETGTVFYTSLKPWARKKSDLWEFSSFLSYWGWKL